MRPPTEDDLLQLIAQALQHGHADAAERYGAQLEAARPPRPALSTVSAALWYALRGLPVFPLRPGLKQPLPGSRGFKDASTDPDVIRRWWARVPEANLGIATGHRVDVIDIDGPEGVLSWARAAALPPVLGTVSTPRPGGTHLYVAADPERRQRAKVLPGVDIRVLGGYVVAPPSTGPGGVAYRWRRPLTLGAVA